MSAPPVHDLLERRSVSRIVVLATCLTALMTTVLAVCSVMTLAAVGHLAVELQADRAAAGAVRARLLDGDRAQWAALSRSAEESRRLTAAICAHLTRYGRLHKVCDP